MISLGIDQSMKATGLCLVSFDANGVWTYLRSRTVATPDFNTMRDEMIPFIGLDMPTVVTAEDAFLMKSPQAFKNAIRSAAFVEAVCCQYRIGQMFHIVEAKSWRAKIWGKGKGGMKRDDAKAYSVEFIKSAIAGSPVDVIQNNPHPDDNQGDAFGLSLCGMYDYLAMIREATL